MRRAVPLAATVAAWALFLAACDSSRATPPTVETAVPQPAQQWDAQSVNCVGLASPVPDATAAPGSSGQPLPDLQLGCLVGDDTVKLSALRGPTLLNVWASWCGPCAAEVPFLVQAHRDLGAAVRFVGIDLADTTAAAKLWNAAHRVDWPSLVDPDSSIRGPMRVPGPPVTFFVRADGGVAGVHYGAFTSTDEVRAAIAEKLGSTAGGIG
jgi:thiol-disulfide isomerase/thioredoxin